MTEMPLACAWIWAIVVVLKGRRPGHGLLLAGLLVGVGGWMRPEGWIAIAMWPVLAFMLLRRQVLQGRIAFRRARAMFVGCSIIAGLPTLLWYFLGVFAWHDWRWFIAQWPWSPQSQYGRSGGLFVLSSIVALAVWMWVPVIAGGWGLWRGRREGDPLSLWLIALPAAGFFVLHGVLGSLGLFGSLSLPRYFVCVAPMLAILAVLGLIQMAPKGRFSIFPALIIGLALAPLAVLATLAICPCGPQPSSSASISWFDCCRRRGPVDQQPLIVGHPYPLMLLNLDPDAPAHLRLRPHRRSPRRLLERC